MQVLASWFAPEAHLVDRPQIYLHSTCVLVEGDGRLVVRLTDLSRGGSANLGGLVVHPNR